MKQENVQRNRKNFCSKCEASTFVKVMLGHTVRILLNVILPTNSDRVQRETEAFIHVE